MRFDHSDLLLQLRYPSRRDSGRIAIRTIEIVQVARDAFLELLFGTPKPEKLLEDTGLGDHPEIIRAFYRAGMKSAPDRFVGGKPAKDSKTPGAGSVLYPTQRKVD